MGTIEKGYLDGFSGTVGTAVGSSWKKIKVLRSRPPRRRQVAASELQLANQAKFGLMSTFLRPLTKLFNQTFNKAAGGAMSAYNRAFSENRDAVTGDYPAFAIDYPKVLLSRGSLYNATEATAAAVGAGKLVFTWTDDSAVKNALISDLVFAAVYSEALNQWIFVQKAASRNTGTCTLDVSSFSGKPVQTYIGFISAGRRAVSKSLYTGAVDVL